MKTCIYKLLLVSNLIVFSSAPYAVSIPRQTNTVAVTSVSQFLQQANQSFSIATIPFCKNSILFSNEFLQHNISILTLALVFSNYANPVVQAQIRLNALYSPAQSLPALQEAQTHLAQRFCDDTGKLVINGKDIEFARCIFDVLKDKLPSRLFENLDKIFDYNLCKELYKELHNHISQSEWQECWNIVWQKNNEWLATQAKRSGCSLDQARENQYNKDLYQLFSLCQKKDFSQAEQLVSAHKDESLFNEVFQHYYRHSDQYKNALQKQKSPPSPLAKQIQKLPHQRAAADKKTLNDPKPYTKQYPLSQPTQNYLHHANVPRTFETCHGTHAQQQVHKEITKIHKKTDTLERETDDNPNIKRVTKHIPKFTNLAREYNERGFIKEAYMITDFCWSLLDCACSIATGIGKGILYGTGTYLEYLANNPLEAFMRPFLGNLLCAIRLAQLTSRLINISLIGLKSFVGSQEATDQWHTLCNNMDHIKNSLLTKFNTMTLEEYAQETTALATRFMLDYQCAHLLADIYQTAFTDAQIYVTKFDKHTSQNHFIAYAPDNSIVSSCAQATTILSGNGNLLIEQLVQYSGNSIGSSVEQTFHEQINALVPSHETKKLKIS